MNRSFTALLLFSSVLLAADDLPKAETILDRYVEVTGGKEAYDKIHNEVAKGKMEITGKGIAGTIVSYEAEPNKDYSTVEIEGIGKVESGTDGEVAWERTAITGPRIKTDDERDEIMRAAIFNGHINWRKLYAEVETQGLESVDGEECYKLLLTPKSGRPKTEYYSKMTGFLVKTAAVHTSQMGEIAADDFLKDYKDVSGLKMPFTRISKFAGQEIQVHLESIELNAEIAKDRFDLPEDVKALLRKNGAVNEAK